MSPDLFLLIPSAVSPHKEATEDDPGAEERLKLTELAARSIEGAVVSDMEIKRGGESYTVDTVKELLASFPGAEILFLMGSDMLLSFERWHEAEKLMKLMKLAVLSRQEGDGAELSAYADRLKRLYGADVILLEKPVLDISSSAVRAALRGGRGREFLDEGVYARIIRKRSYHALPDLDWLRREAYAMMKKSRLPHVTGCEQEAVKLAERWGADGQSAAEAAILHDVTKNLVLSEQLILCSDYGIMIDAVERENVKLLHAKTGAGMARHRFGVSDEVYRAIMWHTTGKPGMTLLEKVIYLADYIEPTRDFEGLSELRKLAYENIDKAMALGLQISIENLNERGITPHSRSVKALEWFKGRIQ